jgi:hypothetical protein
VVICWTLGEEKSGTTLQKLTAHEREGGGIKRGQFDHQLFFYDRQRNKLLIAECPIRQ